MVTYSNPRTEVSGDCGHPAEQLIELALTMFREPVFQPARKLQFLPFGAKAVSS